jgi:hypothetical protein
LLKVIYLAMHHALYETIFAILHKCNCCSSITLLQLQLQLQLLCQTKSQLQLQLQLL